MKGTLKPSCLTLLWLCMICLTNCHTETEQRTERPNILIAVADDASFPYMGAYGCTWINTPAFDHVAKNGLLFMNAYTPNAKCAPSRACILTGRNSWQLEEAANHMAYFPAKFQTFMEALKAQGYFTGHVLKGWAPGNPGMVNGKPRELTGPAFNDIKTTPLTTGISEVDYAANFASFLDTRDKDQPFCFWYGAVEPHRGYEYGTGARLGGKKTGSIERVPAFWPDTDTVRNDMLDFAYELEYFDQQLMKMLDILEQRGELDNTLIIVTADNGMPFPRVKGQAYEMSNHLPLAMMWKNGIRNPGRTIEDFISFIDFAPTMIDVAQVSKDSIAMQPIQGRSLVNIFQSDQSGQVDTTRDHVLIGKERHDVGRPHDWGYPIRGIVSKDMLYLRNYKTDRWPAGNPETGYLNTDGSPTKTQILQARTKESTRPYWQWSFGKRPAEELYQIGDAPDCVDNLVNEPEFAGLKAELEAQMIEELKGQGDPRMFGKGYIFDEYNVSFDEQRGFYERYMKGEDVKASWVNPSDFEVIDK